MEKGVTAKNAKFREGWPTTYLKVTGLQLGLLANFGSFPRLEWERIVLTH